MAYQKDVRDLEGFRYPNRKPWILLILLILALVVVIQRVKRPGKRVESDVPAAAQIEGESDVSPALPPEMASTVRGAAPRSHTESGDGARGWLMAPLCGAKGFDGAGNGPAITHGPRRRRARMRRSG